MCHHFDVLIVGRGSGFLEPAALTDTYGLAAKPKASRGSKKQRRQNASSDSIPAFHWRRAGTVAAIMPPSSESKITTTPTTLLEVLIRSAYSRSNTDFANASFASEPVVAAVSVAFSTETILTVFPRSGPQVPGKDA